MAGKTLNERTAVEPLWLALIVQTPPAIMLTVVPLVPLTVQMLVVEEVKVMVPVDVDVADTVNDPEPRVRSAKALKVIVPA